MYQIGAESQPPILSFGCPTHHWIATAFMFPFLLESVHSLGLTHIPQQYHNQNEYFQHEFIGSCHSFLDSVLYLNLNLYYAGLSFVRQKYYHQARPTHHSEPKYVPQYDPKCIISAKFHHHGGFAKGR